jgi:hypothetical protein
MGKKSGSIAFVNPAYRDISEPELENGRLRAPALPG